MDIISNKITCICENEYNYFFNKINVVGVALGYKIKNGFYTKERCIKVFVNKKEYIEKINRNEFIPRCYKGIKTDIVESGSFRLGSLSQRIRPVVGGYSIGTSITDITGTLGCLVRDSTDLYILSNSHVIATGNEVPIGTSILQPSIEDGGDISRDVIGILSKYIKVKFKTFFKTPSNYVDCAIGKVINPMLVSPLIALVGKIQGMVVPSLNQNVKKVGRTTELTTGTIVGLDGTFKLSYGNKKALFKKQIVTLCMADDGDSGSLILDKNNNAVGLIGGVSSIYSIGSPINTVLNSLGVTIVTDEY